MSLITWVKNNKLSVLLLIILGFLLLSKKPPLRTTYQSKTSPSIGALSNRSQPKGILNPMLDMVNNYSGNRSSGSKENAPSPAKESPERMVVQSSRISLVVDDVRQKTDKILEYVKDRSGFMVSSRLNQPQEAPYANLVVRVPSNQLKSTLDFLRQLAVKVTSENIQGHDVTDQYIDIDSRLKTLEKTKTKFEEMMDKAIKIQDILQIQREIINLQRQIDSLKGQKQYLEKTSAMAKLTIYLATDEWSLPFTPSQPSWRPKVIFKQAVRSLVLTLRGLGAKLIWIGFYSIIWLPLFLVAYLIWHIWLKKKKVTSSQPPLKTTETHET